MKEKKYRDDWITEVSLEENGKEKRTPVYQGTWHSFAAGEKAGAMREMTIGLGVCFLCWVLYLALDFPATRVLYVFLPVASAIFPMLYWTLGLISLYRAPVKMTRLQKEKGICRAVRSALGCGLLAGIGFLGDVFFLFQGRTGTREIPGSALLAACACAGVTLFVRHRRYLNDER